MSQRVEVVSNLRVRKNLPEGSTHGLPTLTFVRTFRSFTKRPQCRPEYSGKGFSMYPGAQGNILFFGGGKRFWTDCLYSSLPTEDEQAGWLKEEPPVIYAGECQTL